MISATGEGKISAWQVSAVNAHNWRFTVASLPIGIPLFSGFIGKWYLLLGSMEAGSVIPAVVIIAGSVRLCLPSSGYSVAYFEPTPEVDVRILVFHKGCLNCAGRL